MARGIYIHIPFCEHICYYCNFNKYLIQNQPVWDYLKALEKEMQTLFTRFPGKEISTIFIGGGTPTALDQEQLAYLLASIRKYLVFDSGAVEFTMEANPGRLSREKLEVMREGGVNRLSIGAQSFDDALLTEIGRTHRREDIFSAVDQARAAGFRNLSIDLMFGLPRQTFQNFAETLDEVTALDVDHISIYSLQVESGTVFHNRRKRGMLPLPDEDVEADMYEHLLAVLEKHGFSQYEISNFARDGYECLHNQIYWQNDEYFGLGAGAHSYVDHRRRVNASWFKKYMHLIETNGEACIEEHQVGVREQMEDEMFLGLRQNRGISKQRFACRYGKNLYDVFGDIISDLVERDFLDDNGDQISLTQKGLFLGNDVFAAFINTVA